MIGVIDDRLSRRMSLILVLIMILIPTPIPIRLLLRVRIWMPLGRRPVIRRDIPLMPTTSGSGSAPCSCSCTRSGTDDRFRHCMLRRLPPFSLHQQQPHLVRQAHAPLRIDAFDANELWKAIQDLLRCQPMDGNVCCVDCLIPRCRLLVELLLFEMMELELSNICEFRSRDPTDPAPAGDG